ncbi:MAG: mannosyl-3-phosphoglycerate synthase [Blastocatellia bacterium]
MRIELPREAQRFGGNLFYGVQKVYELDAGLSADQLPYELQFVIRQVPYEALHEIEKQMAIIVPMKAERLRLLEGVLFAIPHACQVIVVSNSPREPVDRFNMEVNAVESFRTFTKKNLVIVHQKDPVAAQAFARAGYPELLDKDGLIRNGKAEGMILGLMLARLAGKKYVGFVDVDNFIPGSVLEYVRAYSTGFALSKSRCAMVRMLWHSKPKIVESQLYFTRYGRASILTNEYLNRLINYRTGFETEVIKTGNAGEHALSMELAMRLDYAAGYGVETYHFVNLLEKFGVVRKSPYPDMMKEGIEIFQIESRNPHLHDISKGEEHIHEMMQASLGVIYQSFTCSETLRREILHELRRRKVIGKRATPPAVRIYPALDRIDPAVFAKAIDGQPYALVIEPPKPAGRAKAGKEARAKSRASGDPRKKGRKREK